MPPRLTSEIQVEAVGRVDHRQSCIRSIRSCRVRNIQSICFRAHRIGRTVPGRRAGIRQGHIRGARRRWYGTGVRRSLRSKLGDKSMDVYAVNYPASLDFQTAADGVIDASNGSRRGRGVPEHQDRSRWFLAGRGRRGIPHGGLGARRFPDPTVSPGRCPGGRRPRRRGGALRQAVERVPADDRQHRTADHGRTPFSGKTADLCIPDDPVCSPGGGDNNAHNLYPANGLTDQAADFVAQKVLSAPAAETAG